MQETQVRPLGRADPLEKGMATHPSVLAWRIPRTEEQVDSLPAEPQGTISDMIPLTEIQCYLNSFLKAIRILVFFSPQNLAFIPQNFILS